MAEKIAGALRAKMEEEIEKKYGEGDGISYGTIMDLKSETKNPLSRMYGVNYGTQLSSGAIQAREAAAGSKSKPGRLEALNSPAAKKAGREYAAEERREARGKKKGGVVKSASTRADGIAQRGKTKGRMV